MKRTLNGVCVCVCVCVCVSVRVCVYFDVNIVCVRDRVRGVLGHRS